MPDLDNMIDADSTICHYCANHNTNDPQYQHECDECDTYDLTNFIGIECYKTIED